MALRLHAVTATEGALAEQPSSGRHTGMFAVVREGIQLVPFRDLSAVVSEQPDFGLTEPTDSEVERHREIVDGIFRRTTVIPAPLGTVFRSADVLTRWMELHNETLTGALEFVEDRAVARVHIVRADGNEDNIETGSD